MFKWRDSRDRAAWNEEKLGFGVRTDGTTNAYLTEIPKPIEHGTVLAEID